MIALARTAPIDPDEWVPIREARRLLGLSFRRLRDRCVDEWEPQRLACLDGNPSRKGRRCWWIRRTADPRLARCPDRETRDRDLDLSAYPRSYVETAMHRRDAVQRYLDLKRSSAPGPREAEIAERVAAEARQRPGFKCSVSTLRSWRVAHRSDGLRGVIPGYVTVADVQIGTGNGGPNRSREAVAFFESLYLTERCLTKKLCHRRTREEAKRRRWQWPPSYSATRTWWDEYGDRQREVLMREGYKAWAHRFMPYIEQDNNAVAPGEMYVADSKRCDFFINVDGKAVRPWLIAFLDIASRMIVAFELCESGNQDTILLAVRRAFLRFGVPSVLKIDNGCDYSARLFHGFTKAQCRRLRKEYGPKWREVIRHETKQVACDRPEWKGLFPELGVRVIFAQPYEPQAKAPVERWFRTSDSQCACLLPGYCGPSSAKRTDALDAQRKEPQTLLTLAQARDRVRLYIREYHDTPHSGLGGLTPAEKWASTQKVIRTADEGALDLLLQIRGQRRVGKNGVTVSFGGAAIRFGQYDGDLRRYAGRDVLVACDPQDPSHVVCLDPQTRRLICRASANERMAPNATGEAMRTAQADLARARREAKRARASAGKRQRTVVQIANENVRRQRLAATGTDDRRPDANTVLSPIRTGFEGASRMLTAAPRGVEIDTVSPVDTGPLDPSDWIEDDDAGDAPSTAAPRDGAPDFDELD